MGLRVLYKFVMMCSFVGFTVIPSALAQISKRESAKEHYERGKELAKEEEYQKAVAEFQRAYEISPNFEVLYNLGISYVGSGDSVRAVETLSRYLREGGNRVSQEYHAMVMKELKRQKMRIAFLTIEVNTDNSRVKIDGREVGLSPINKVLRVSSGDHMITVKHQGYQTEEKKLTLAGKDRKTLRFKLQPLPVVTVENSGQLIVKCNVPDVHVFVDLKKSGITPLEAPVLVRCFFRQLLLTNHI